jgi:hypothetical protein
MASASQRARKNRQRKYVNREMTNQPTINQTNNTGEKKMDKEITDLSEYKKTRKFSIKRLSKLVRTKIVAVKTAVKRFAAWWKAPVETTNGAEVAQSMATGVMAGVAIVAVYTCVNMSKLISRYASFVREVKPTLQHAGDIVHEVTNFFANNPDVAEKFNAASTSVQFTG